MIILLGSKALAEYTDKITPSNDIDIVGNYDEVVDYMKTSQIVYPTQLYPINSGKKLIAKYPNGKIIEAEINWGKGSVNSMCNLVKADPYSSVRSIGGIDVLVPSLNFLYTLKMSHRFLKDSPFFLKTMKHIHLMRELGAEIRPAYKHFLKEREVETYYYGHPKLNVDRKTFFSDDGVNYVFDHDSIHEVVKHLEKPAYNYYSNQEVMCSKKLWDKCSYEVQLFGGLEEALVLAIERSQVPFKGKVDPVKSFKMALFKVCTSITSGWFRSFCYENYFQIVEAFEKNDTDYVERFWDAVNKGKVPLAK